MVAKIKSITFQNFKGCKNATYAFNGKNVTVCGANGSGKTTIFDAFTWLLFGKDSLDNAKFEIRPLDKDGKQIDNVEICVSATLEIDGKEVELKKTQKQNWVKKRGTQNPVLQGNVNEYEIDGYPRSEKDYKEYINGIVSDDLFKMLTNPTYFPNMPWKEQRNVLMLFESGLTDEEIISKNIKFEPISEDLKRARDLRVATVDEILEGKIYDIKLNYLDDVKSKYQKSLNELKKKPIELSVRIDEISNSKVDIDVAELELLKNSLNEQIADVKSKIADTDKQFEEYQKLSDGIMELKFAESDLVRKANEDNIKARMDIDNKIADKKFLVSKVKKTISDTEKEIALNKDMIKHYEADLNKARYEWNAEIEREFDENSLICPYCKQEYPADKKEQLRADFKAHKESELNRITDKGNTAKENLENEKNTLARLEAELPEHKKSLEMLNNAIADIEKQLSELPTSIDVTGTDEYKAIQSQIAEKEQAMSQMNNADEARKALNYELECSQSQLIECEKKIAMSQKNIEIDERIEELQAKQRDVAQKIADVEKMLYLLDEFIKYKLDKISDSINSQFEMVNFILFKSQLNGGIAETCECQYNGIPFGSLNSAARIQCGLDIIRTLQRMYGVFVPVFVDNRESCTNIPKMDCQVISLVVSPTDTDLRIEVE